MSLLNKGPSNSDFADGPLLCVECPLRACVRISYMRARARFLVLLNCYMNYLFFSFFRVGRAFFKVVILFELYSFAPLTVKTLFHMLPFEFYQIVAYPSDLSDPTRYENHETLSSAVRAVPSWLASSCKVYIYRFIVPVVGNIMRKVISSYESE